MVINSKTVDIILSGGGWSGSSPCTYKITNSAILLSSIIDIIFNPNSASLVEVISKAQIGGYDQTDGNITIYAWGEKPNMDIPVTLVVRGGI